MTFRSDTRAAGPQAPAQAGARTLRRFGLPIALGLC
jgi:hypothetical protein